MYMKAKVIRIVFLIALFIVISRLGYFLMTKTTLSDEIQTYVAKIIFGIVISCYSIYFIKKYKYHYLIGISRPSFRNAYLYIYPLYIVLLIDISNIKNLNVWQMVIPFAGVFFHAFAEELTIRGLILPTLIERKQISAQSIKNAIWVSAIIFGLVHFISLSEYDFTSAITQVVYATIHGLFFGMLLIKGRNIYLISISHTLVNFFNRIKHIEQPPLVITDANDSQSLLLTITLTIVLFSPLIGIALLFIRKINDEDASEVRAALFAAGKEHTGY